MPQANAWTPEDGDSEWWPDPKRPLTSYTDAELRFTPLYRRLRGMIGLDDDAVLLAECRTAIEGYLIEVGPEQTDEPEPVKLRFVP